MRLASLVIGAAVCIAMSTANSQPLLAEFQLPKPPGPFCALQADQLKEVKSYRADEPVIGTYFFYWYNDQTREHFINGDGTDALVDHPANPKGYSYASKRWWKRELLDVKAAGIDFILPVYWGSPGFHAEWSFKGLPPLVGAWEELTREGKKPPRVGLFYDTSTLQYNPTGAHVDLSNDAGKNWFYATIRDFFSFIPPKMWAAIDGRPIVVLYASAFAAKQDSKQFPFLRDHFKQDFATDLYLVKSVGWEGEADSLSSWGGALGLQNYSVAALGPGYDHHAVPGRTPLVVDRKGGKFYTNLWEQFLSFRLARRAKVLLVETWNELHEGTDIAHTKEYGRQYINLTAKYAKLFKQNTVLPKKGPFAQAKAVEWDAATLEAGQGISMSNAGDGLMEATEAVGRKCWRTRPNPHGSGRYVYLALDDSFLFDEDNASVTAEVEYLDRDFESFFVEYDNTDPGASVREGAFKSQGEVFRCAKSGEWKKVTITLTNGRFANRCNGADFRLNVAGGDLGVSRVRVTRR
ncbi:MAG: DUF5010 domain-containing protein [Armatimonadetes bacterium]|nr:DUF5010 domain-containing protein [Armatimonadota bacterium]